MGLLSPGSISSPVGHQPWEHAQQRPGLAGECYTGEVEELQARALGCRFGANPCWVFIGPSDLVLTLLSTGYENRALSTVPGSDEALGKGSYTVTYCTATMIILFIAPLWVRSSSFLLGFGQQLPKFILSPVSLFLTSQLYTREPLSLPD